MQPRGDAVPFEEFDKRAAVASKSPFVTIQRKGTFSMNQAAYVLMGKPKVVTLLFDPEEKLIGFRPTLQSSPRAFPVRAQQNGVTYVVAGQAFAKHYGIDTSVARRYGVDKQDDILVLDLKSESTDATGPRARSRDREPV